MKEAALYGLKRGVFQAAAWTICLLLIKPAFWAGAWAHEQVLLLMHGGGDIWLST